MAIASPRLLKRLGLRPTHRNVSLASASPLAFFIPSSTEVGGIVHCVSKADFSLVLRTYPGRLATAGGNGCPSGASAEHWLKKKASRKKPESTPYVVSIGRIM